MSCPDTGALRAVHNDQRRDLVAHAGSCAACRERTRELTDDARLAAAAPAGTCEHADTMGPCSDGTW